jgi:hypothetical protein
MVAIMVLSACLTTSNTLRPVLSAGAPVVGSAGMVASVLIDPDTSMTQQMSNGARLPGPFSEADAGSVGGTTVTSTCLASGSAERLIVGEFDVFNATVIVSDNDRTDSVVGLVSCMAIGVVRARTRSRL